MMKRLRIWLVRLGSLLLVLAVLLGVIGTVFVRRSWPETSGTLQIAGLENRVEILRDQWGVPNIYAQNDHDLFFAQGYSHAQDRLWQMELIRHLASGTLSEVVGADTLELDRYMRTLGLRRIAEQSWSKLDEDSRKFLEIYAAGVNAYIESHRDRLPVEYTILGLSPEPWTPVDSMVVGNILALNMGLNREEELLRAEVVAKVGEQSAQQLFQPDGNMPSIVPAGIQNFDGLRNAPVDLSMVKTWLADPFLGWGSNNWVVHGNRTGTGSPLLANDTHLGLQMPSVWYENGLHGGRFDSTGFTVPGVPLVVFGHNQYLAWGGTNLDPDVQDFYIEKLDDRKKPTQYEFMGKWLDLQAIPETIKVKGGQPVDFSVYLTRHGPIMNLETANEEPMALRWNLYEDSRVFNAIIQVNLAKDWKDFHAALRDWDTLSQNFVYADLEGNIGYQAAGKIPIRNAQHSGKEPIPGWSGEYEWQGYIPYEKLPSFLNPPAGFIATANNKVGPDDYPYQLSYQYFPGYRALRINQLLSATEKATPADMRTIQADTYSLAAEALRPYLVTAAQPQTELESKALDEMKAWDLYLETDRVGASIYEAWYMFLIQDTVNDELGNGLGGWYQQDIRTNEPTMVEWMKDPHTVWFDDVTTSAQKETRDDIIRRSFGEAVKWLSDHYGGDPQQWQWGRIHTTTFINDPLGRSGIPVLESLVNAGPIASPGDMSTVNQAWYGWPDQPFGVFHGTSQRMIIDLSNWDLMLAVNSTGQSGHLFHPNSKDQISMWQKVEYHPVPFTRAAVEKSAQAILTLIP